MAIKNYYIKTERNTRSEILYIVTTYANGNRGLVGVHNSNILRAKLDFATQAQENAFLEDMTSRGCIYLWVENELIDLSLYHQSAKDNQLIFQITQNIQLNNLSTTYTDVFPVFYDGIPIPLDTYGYKKLGMVIMWNKNGGTGTHTIKLSKCNQNGVITQPEEILRENNTSNGYISDFNYSLPTEFINFKGFVKLQAKSSNGTDSPIFDGLWLYNIRR